MSLKSLAEIILGIVLIIVEYYRCKKQGTPEWFVLIMRSKINEKSDTDS